MSALDYQPGGQNHYSSLSIQPIEYAEKNGLTPLAHLIVKYVTRVGRKGNDEDAKQDIEKIIHCAELMQELYYGEEG